MRTTTFFALTALLLPGCAAPVTEDEDITGTSDAPIVNESNVFCPAGFAFDKPSRLCLSSKDAVGPFPSAMIASCKRSGGGDETCEGARWSRQLAVGLRGTGQCPTGTTFDSRLGFCAEGDDVFGPFSRAMVDRCKRNGGGNATCETMRWSKTFIAPGDGAPAQGGRVLDVPYQSQLTAPTNPNGSCGNTSAAMLLTFSGKRISHEGVRSRYGGGSACGAPYKDWQCAGGLEGIYRREGLTGDSTYRGSRTLIKRQIDAGRPVVVHTQMTGSGHIILIVGYDDAKREWVAHDPYGTWCGGFRGGYTSCGGRGRGGAYVRYPYSWMSNSVLGGDGDIAMSTADTEGFTL